MSQAFFAREERENEGDPEDGELIDFRIGRARQTLRETMKILQDMLARLNARPGSGMMFPLIMDIVRAERAVKDARATLRSVDTQANSPPPSRSDTPSP